MSNLWRPDPQHERLRRSRSYSVLLAQASASGVFFEYQRGAFVTHGLTSDARRADVQRWEAGCALASLGRAVREHKKLAGDPLLRWALFYTAIDYVADIL